MNRLTRQVASAVLLAMLWAQAWATEPPLELRNALPTATLAGSSRLTFWGFDIYDAKLWTGPQFEASTYEQHGFALELIYLRDFTNEAITKRSIDEMQRVSDIPDNQRTRWQQSMRDAFPDIKKGDRIIGINRPGAGAVFLTNGRATGHIRDPEFARRFFGIWLSTQTSEPRLREALLAPLASR